MRSQPSQVSASAPRDRKPSRWLARITFSTVSALYFASGPCAASEVSFTGGFTTFSGPVGTALNDPEIVTTVNGRTVFADEAFPGAEYGFDNFGLGFLRPISLLTPAGAPVSTVDFRRRISGESVPNVVEFLPSQSLDLRRGSEFVIGTFTLQNGAWFGNTPTENFFTDTMIGFKVMTHSADPALDGLVFEDALRFHVTNPVGPHTAEDAADYFSFANRPLLGGMWVYENVDPQGVPTSNTATFALVVRIGSLVPQRLDFVSGGGFVAAVPEPASAWMLAVGVLAVGAGVARRKR